MEFLGGLGIDIKLLVAQMINFGLLLWLLARFVYRPIIKRIEKDETELKQAQIQKKELERQRIVFVQKEKNEIARAKQRAREIMEEAENIAQRIKDQARREAEQEKRAIIKQIKSHLSEIEHAENSKREK